MLDERTSLFDTLRHPLSQSAAEVEEEITSYASGRIGNKPQLTVTFRQVDGSSQAFAYSHLYSVAADAESGSFAVEFSQHVVLILGRNLAHLHRLLCDHKVHTVQELSPTQAMALPEQQPVVTSVRVSKVET